MGFTSGQLKIASQFCNDVAKTIMSAAILGQGFIGNLKSESRIVMSLGWLSISTILFMLAMIISKRLK